MLCFPVVREHKTEWRFYLFIIFAGFRFFVGVICEAFLLKLGIFDWL